MSLFLPTAVQINSVISANILTFHSRQTPGSGECSYLAEQEYNTVSGCLRQHNKEGSYLQLVLTSLTGKNCSDTWALFLFPLVYKPYCRQVVGKKVLSISQFTHEASAGYDTDTPYVIFWTGKRLSQILAETVKSSVQHQKVARIVASLSRVLLYLSFPKTIIA